MDDTPQKSNAKFMRIFRSKLLWIIIIIAVGGSAYAYLKPESQPEYTTEAAVRQDLLQTVAATGSVQGAEEIELNFETVGILAELNVEKGDSVSAGDTLAKLSARNQENAVAEARANMQAAQATLDKLIAGASAEDIAVSQEAVTQAEVSYDNTVQELDNLKSKLATDEQTYRDEVESKVLDYTSAKSSAINTMSSELFDAETALSRVEDVLENEDAQNTLGSRDVITKYTAQHTYDTGVAELDKAMTDLAVAKQTKSDQDISAALDQSIAVLIAVSDALSKTYTMLVNTPDSTKYTETEIATDKTNIKSDQATVSSSISTVQSANDALDSASSLLTTAKNNLQTFLASKQQQIDAAEGAIRSAERSLAVAKSQLKLKQAPARSEDIALQRAKVAQVRAALSRARSTLDQMTIMAPVEGQITKVNYDVGEKTNLSRPVMTLIGESGLEIEVDIPESDIAKVEVGQTATITLDAFGSDREFIGRVTFIDPAETVISDVVYYQVKVTFDKIEADIKPGMTANIDIVTAEKDGVLVVPTRAIKRNGEKFVEVLVNGQVIEKQVTTGLRGDGGLTEIISGLDEGDQVITFKEEVE